MAPDLVQIQRYFEEQQEDVVFVSLTLETASRAERFARRYGIAWPVGWRAQAFVDEYLGDRYPALIVVGRDGRVAWNDGAARLWHRDAEIAPLLFDQIETALSR